MEENPKETTDALAKFLLALDFPLGAVLKEKFRASHGRPELLVETIAGEQSLYRLCAKPAAQRYNQRGHTHCNQRRSQN
jgi:hypothetical protein